MNKSAVWPHAGANTGSPRIDQRPLVVCRGRVVSVADRVTSTTISGPNGYTDINSVPEVWISDAEGKELRFCDITVADCRVGHEVAIVVDPAKSRLLSMRNLTTGQTRYAPSMADLPVNRRHIMSMVGVGIILFCITWFITVAVFGDPWARKTIWQQNGPKLFYGVALYLSWWLPERGRRAINGRNDALRARIERELEEASA
ncbi:MAG: hypothetical protein ACK46Q_15350 [Hyphomonas sp.]